MDNLPINLNATETVSAWLRRQGYSISQLDEIDGDHHTIFVEIALPEDLVRKAKTLKRDLEKLNGTLFRPHMMHIEVHFELPSGYHKLSVTGREEVWEQAAEAVKSRVKRGIDKPLLLK